MTYLDGEWRIYNGKHRLFELISDLLIITSSISKAFNFTAGKWVTYNIGDVASFESNQFPLEVKLPLVGPIELALDGLKPNSIALGFQKISADQQTKPPANNTNLQTVLNHVVGSIFTTFYENHATWISANVHGDKSKWPPPYGFARVVRNAFSHGGVINIDNPKTPDMSWHNLTYGPAQNKRQIIGMDLPFADIIILIVEMRDDLDRRGCPLAP
jgi:hypothetical protein